MAELPGPQSPVRTAPAAKSTYCLPFAIHSALRFVVADRPQRLRPRGSVPLTEEELEEVREASTASIPLASLKIFLAASM